MRTDGPVVIALDGTMNSEHTLEWGAQEAVRRRADIVLVRAAPDPWLTTEWGWYPPVGGPGLVSEVTEYLTEHRRRLAERHPSVRVDAQALHGAVVPCLRERSEDAQLLVVGARTGRARTGTVGVHVAAHAHCPVAVVRTHAGRPVQPDAAVVVGVDGSSASLAAAHAAAREAWMRGRPLTVVHARPTVPDPFGLGTVPPLATADGDDPTHKAARVVAESLRAAHEGLAVDLALVDDDPAHALTGFARGAPLLVVGSRGLGAFRGMLLGSISSAVVREATCPVLVVHDDE